MSTTRSNYREDEEIRDRKREHIDLAEYVDQGKRDHDQGSELLCGPYIVYPGRDDHAHLHRGDGCEGHQQQHDDRHDRIGIIEIAQQAKGDGVDQAHEDHPADPDGSQWGEECPDALTEKDLAVGDGGSEQRLQALFLFFADNRVGCDRGREGGRTDQEEEGKGIYDGEQS